MSEDVTFARVINAPPEVVFAAFTGQGGQEAFYSEPGWSVESECDLRVGGVWIVTFGRSRDEVYRHEHVFRVIDRPHRLLLATTESRPDGSIIEYETELIFEERDGKTLMTMVHRGLPTAELRDEHGAGVPGAFTRLEQVIEESPPLRQGDPSEKPTRHGGDAVHPLGDGGAKPDHRSPREGEPRWERSP